MTSVGKAITCVTEKSALRNFTNLTLRIFKILFVDFDFLKY